MLAVDQCISVSAIVNIAILTMADTLMLRRRRYVIRRTNSYEKVEAPPFRKREKQYFDWFLLYVLVNGVSFHFRFTCQPSVSWKLGLVSSPCRADTNPVERTKEQRRRTR